MNENHPDLYVRIPTHGTTLTRAARAMPDISSVHTTTEACTTAQPGPNVHPLERDGTTTTLLLLLFRLCRLLCPCRLCRLRLPAAAF